MNKRITVDQLKKLTNPQERLLRDWYKAEDGDWFYRPTNGLTAIYGGIVFIDEQEGYLLKPDANDLPLLSIGQMFEFLHANKTGVFEMNYIDYTWTTTNLCNRLWEKVKEALQLRTL